VASELTVVKVGGSLYDLPDLGPRLRRWSQALGGEVLLVPGGGPTAGAVRELDYWQKLGEEQAHWLALGALSLNAQFLARTLAPAAVVEVPQDRLYLEAGVVPIIDPQAFVLMDERSSDHLPHTWDVTSDSIAARLATLTGARNLVLLKSVTIPPEMSWAEASQLGLVDVMFPRLIEQAGPKLRVEAINFREWQP
jgi:aspartokinase-like uncharacterized kinase